MRTFGFFIAVLLVEAGELFSMNEITTRTFSKMNCSPLQDQGSYIEVKLRSRLECASTCARKTCNSYKYFKQTSVCRMSFYGAANDSDGWYCGPALNTGKSRLIDWLICCFVSLSWIFHSIVTSPLLHVFGLLAVIIVPYLIRLIDWLM